MVIDNLFFVFVFQMVHLMETAYLDKEVAAGVNSPIMISLLSK